MKILQLAAVAVLTMGLSQMAYAEHDAKDGKHCTRGSHMQDADTNKDGAVSHEEFNAQHQKMADKMFTKMDANNDGKIDQSEREAMHGKNGKHCDRKDHKMDDSSK